MKYFILGIVGITMLQANPRESNIYKETGRILVFSKTDGFRHDSIEPGKDALIQLGMQHGVRVDTTEDAVLFTGANLSRYDAIVFLNTSETVFNDDQRMAFKQYIRNGGGFAGIHAASATEYEWPWYHNMIGASFDNHPSNPAVRNADVEVVDPDHRSTRHLPERWNRDDEWYNFRNKNPKVNVLLKLDTDSYEGSDHPGNHPIAWYHEYEEGRIFYTALGHTIESFSEEKYLKHLWGGIEYAMGRGP